VPLVRAAAAPRSATIGLRRPTGTTPLDLRTRGITRRPAFRIGAPGGGWYVNREYAVGVSPTIIKEGAAVLATGAPALALFVSFRYAVTRTAGFSEILPWVETAGRQALSPAERQKKWRLRYPPDPPHEQSAKVALWRLGLEQAIAAIEEYRGEVRDLLV
jgi:hypothetical protein